MEAGYHRVAVKRYENVYENEAEKRWNYWIVWRFKSFLRNQKTAHFSKEMGGFPFLKIISAASSQSAPDRRLAFGHSENAPGCA